MDPQQTDKSGSSPKKMVASNFCGERCWTRYPLLKCPAVHARGKVQEMAFKGLDYGNKFFQSNEEAFGGHLRPMETGAIAPDQENPPPVHQGAPGRKQPLKRDPDRARVQGAHHMLYWHTVRSTTMPLDGKILPRWTPRGVGDAASP